MKARTFKVSWGRHIGEKEVKVNPVNVVGWGNPLNTVRGILGKATYGREDYPVDIHRSDFVSRAGDDGVWEGVMNTTPFTIIDVELNRKTHTESLKKAVERKNKKDEQQNASLNELRAREEPWIGRNAQGIIDLYQPVAAPGPIQWIEWNHVGVNNVAIGVNALNLIPVPPIPDDEI